MRIGQIFVREGWCARLHRLCKGVPGVQQNAPDSTPAFSQSKKKARTGFFFRFLKLRKHRTVRIPGFFSESRKQRLTGFCVWRTFLWPRNALPPSEAVPEISSTVFGVRASGPLSSPGAGPSRTRSSHPWRMELGHGVHIREGQPASRDTVYPIS